MTSSNNDPINHHYIPQFLLRRWMSSDNKVQYYKRVYGGKFISDRISPGNTAYEPLLYTRHIEVNVMQKEIDNNAALVVDKIISQGLAILTGGDCESMAKFIASLWLRYPAEVHKNNILGKEVLEELMNRPAAIEEYHKIRSPKHPLNPIEAINQCYDQEIMDHFGLIASCSLMMGERSEGRVVIQDILKLEWELVSFEQVDTNLLIADNPCVRVDGISNPDCSIIALPLSPKHVFLAAWNRKTIDEIIGFKKLKLAGYLNNLSVQQAAKYVYAFDNRHKDLVEATLSKIVLQ